MKKLLILVIALSIFFTLSVSALALDGSAESTLPDRFYLWFTENAGNILSLLSLIGTLFLAFTYKKGLLPRLTSALGSVSDGVQKMKEGTLEMGKKYERALGGAVERCDRIELMLGSTAQSLDELKKSLEKDDVFKDEYRKLHVILLAQVDMLYDIFTTSSLPQFAKEEVGVKIAKMRAELGAEGTDE